MTDTTAATTTTTDQTAAAQAASASQGTTTTQASGASDAAGAGGQGGQTTATPDWLKSADWHAALPANLKADPNVVRYKTPEDAISALAAANKRFGVPQERLLTMPDKPRSEDPEAWKALDKAFGVPESVEGYGIKLPDTASDFDKTTFNDFAGKMLAAGASKAQMDVATQEFARAMQVTADKAVADENAAIEAAQTAVKAAWGAKFDTYKTEITNLIENSKTADGKPVLTPDEIAELNESKFGASVPLLKLLAHMTDLKAEPETLAGGQGGRANTGERGMTPAQANAARVTLEADPVKRAALDDNSHPMHAVVMAERRKLLAAENPPKA